MSTPAATITISTTMATRKSRYMASVMGVRRGPWSPVPLGWLTPPTLSDDGRFRPFGSLQACRDLFVDEDDMAAAEILGIFVQGRAATRFLIHLRA
jgi:hypothetical protein